MSDVQIAGCFNAGPGRRHRVRLLGGAEEPIYLPAASAGGMAIVRYTRDHAASVLHELAHWCIAGSRRRDRVDYGYWYVPPPRSPAAQRDFEMVEVRVQALEKVFAAACGLDFRVSLDAVSADPGDPAADTRPRRDGSDFAGAVEAEAGRIHERGGPPRAREVLAVIGRFQARRSVGVVGPARSGE